MWTGALTELRIRRLPRRFPAVPALTTTRLRRQEPPITTGLPPTRPQPAAGVRRVSRKAPSPTFLNRTTLRPRQTARRRLPLPGPTGQQARPVSKYFVVREAAAPPIQHPYSPPGPM